MQAISAPIFTASPHAEFPFPINCASLPLDLKSEFFRFSLGTVPSLPSLQRPCNTHYEVTQSSPGYPDTAPLPCPMSVCGGTFADRIPRGGIASVSTTATTQRINLPGLLTEGRVEEASKALSSKKGLQLCAESQKGCSLDKEARGQRRVF